MITTTATDKGLAYVCNGREREVVHHSRGGNPGSDLNLDAAVQLYEQCHGRADNDACDDDQKAEAEDRVMGDEPDERA